MCSRWAFLFCVCGYRLLKPKTSHDQLCKAIQFTTQEGKQLREQEHLGKVTVVEYFFTTCTSICTQMNRNMKKVYDEFKGHPDFQVVCITSMPESDSVGRLKYYADSLHLDPKNWILLTGRKDSLYKAARVSYLLDDPKLPLTNIEDQFIHTQFFALVDKNGDVRGQVYDGLKATEIDRLKEHVGKLLKEKQGKGHAPNLFGTPK